ncbi:hypothetical protein AVEN_175054-1 [Araneus ventricosus]|uniref:Uncharacterized protein n=1 Tax=Araneus ventricosus TaxID=182803 RepID=A0A4Y2MM25_ARAVE|nr:hypothetical protein AVEN_175054-1 [Araneus ventricosus]
MISPNSFMTIVCAGRGNIADCTHTCSRGDRPESINFSRNKFSPVFISPGRQKRVSGKRASLHCGVLAGMDTPERAIHGERTDPRQHRQRAHRMGDIRWKYLPSISSLLHLPEETPRTRSPIRKPNATGRKNLSDESCLLALCVCVRDLSVHDRSITNFINIALKME